MTPMTNGRANARPMDARQRIQPVSATPMLLPLSEVCKLMQLSKSTVERLVRSDPTFPQPRRITGKRSIRFITDEVRAYITALPAIEYPDHGFTPNGDEENG